MKHFIAEELSDKEFTKIEIQKIQMMSNFLTEKNPAIVGVAILKLDCGCIKTAGVLPDGSPMKKGTGIISGQDGTPEEKKKGIMKVCVKCMEDGGTGSERVILTAMAWKKPLPKEEKEKIFEKVFGK